AHELALSESLAEEAYMAALLHDLGKVAVPQEILLKPGPLADEEREEIRQHPVLGVMILQPAGFPPGVLVAIRHHHEDYDGGGYPDGLRGEEIPLAARLIRVADAFDAMTSARPYREPMAPEEALRELRRGAGRQFDPVLVELFLRLRERDRAVPPAVERPGTLLSLLVEVLAGLAVGRP
ncbi:MAG: HD-GYP domain-containing protein, partial [Firmicutes bacterium]|nr:HD-GYP domain-containing protein [Bacillota bacterium]